MKIVGSVAVVTGGAQGFGKAFVEALLKRGGKVCFADMNSVQGAETEQYFKRQYGDHSSMFMRCDVTNEADVKSLFSAVIQKFSNISLFVNNAGILNENEPQRTIDVNLIGAIRCQQLAIDHMRKDHGGQGGLIVNVASAAATFPTFFMPSYTASKHGILGYTRAWANNPLSVSRYGISFACLCPSFSDTNMFNAVTGVADPPLTTFRENKDEIEQAIAAVGVNSVEEVTDAFLQLVEADDNNGMVLSVDRLQGIRQRFKKGPRGGKL